MQGDPSIPQHDLQNREHIILYNPYQFSAYVDGDITTTDNVAITVLFDVENFDNNDNYDPTTGIYTCPVDGYYQFNVCVDITGAAGSREYWETVAALRNNAATIDQTQRYFFDTTQITHDTMRMSGLYFCESGDQIDVRARADNASGATWTVEGVSPYHSTFNGFLVSRV